MHRGHARAHYNFTQFDTVSSISCRDCIVRVQHSRASQYHSDGGRNAVPLVGALRRRWEETMLQRLMRRAHAGIRGS